MNNLKEILSGSNMNSDRPVSAKRLYDFLGFNKAHWTRWYTKNILKNPFAIENKDWQGFSLLVNGNKTMDFDISIDFAKKISMMVEGEKGEKARNHFLRMEKIALYSFSATPKLEDHTKKEIQIKNSKEVNAFNYFRGGVESIVKHNRDNCKYHTNKYPNEIKKEAKKNKLPSKIRTSAKEIVRYLDPVSACSMSLADDMVKMGAKLEDVVKLTNNQGRDIFNFMLKNGIVPGELNR